MYRTMLPDVQRSCVSRARLPPSWVCSSIQMLSVKTFLRCLDAVIDRINKVNGTETIVLGSQQYTKKDGKGKEGTEKVLKI